MIFCLQSCASAPRVGVRTGFESRTIQRIAVAPMWSNSHFGATPDAWRQLETEAIRDIIHELEAMGFTAVTPPALRDNLERNRAWDRFVDLLEFGDGLDNRFEPSLYTPATAEVLGLRELGQQNLVNAPAILFTEIVYHSRGTCSVDPRDHSRFAVVVGRNGADVDARAPSACVVTHIQAKLVDVSTASTMWHNRVLRELRAPAVSDDDDLANVRETSNSVISGAHGLAPFAPRAARR